MKVGQALSVFEAALPEETAAPVPRGADPACRRPRRRCRPRPSIRSWPSSSAARWPERFRDFDDVPAAAASIGQVHRAIWARRPEVAVKIQYPGAGPALMADFTQLSRLAWLFARISPGLESSRCSPSSRSGCSRSSTTRSRPTPSGHSPRAFAGDPEIAVPQVVASAPKVIVTEWMDGTPLSWIIAHGTTSERDQAGYLLALLHFRRPPGPACCMPIRTRATSACCPTAGSASSTSARSRGCPAARQRRSAG